MLWFLCPLSKTVARIVGGAASVHSEMGGLKKLRVYIQLDSNFIRSFCLVLFRNIEEKHEK